MVKSETLKEAFMEIRKSKITDLGSLVLLFDEARATIAKLGINQWQNGYPTEEDILKDIELQQSYSVFEGERLVASFALITSGEPTYDCIYDGAWLTSAEYVAIHRVAIALSERGKGIAPRIISFAESLVKSLFRASLRIDTHEGNIVMRKMLEKNGFTYCGVIFLENGEKRVAYEKII